MSKIEFEFIDHRFDYQLPLLNVDLAFVRARKVEILACMQQLAGMIPSFNIASKKGVSDFGMASRLVKYYHNALMTVSNKEYILIHGERVQTEDELIKHSVFMYDQTGRKAR